MLGRKEPRLAGPQIARRVPLQWPGSVFWYWHWWQLPVHSSREDPTGHARGKSQYIPGPVLTAKLTEIIDRLGHQQVQQQSRVACGRLATLRPLHR